jgi:hypothetical protein
MVQKILVLGAVIAVFAAPCVAQQSATKGKNATAAKLQSASLTTLRGYVVDAMCAKAMVGRENAMKRAAAHTKTCALEEACSAAGYGVFADGKWYKFDENGDKKAKAMISASAREKELSFEVSGRSLDNQFVVASLKEITLSTDKKPAAEKAHRHKHE